MHVIVIGAGLLGLTTAFFLRRAGATVTVLERREGPGLETSFANGAMLHASQANPWNEPGVALTALKMLGREDAALLVRPRAVPGLWRWGLAFIRHSQPERYLRNFEKNAALAAYSLAQMATIRAALTGAYDHAQVGTMKLFRTAAEVTAAARLCTQLSSWGIQYEVIEARRAAALEPALAPIASELAGGLYFPGDESGDAYKFCLLLAARLTGDGVEFRFTSPVLGMNVVRDGVRIRTANDEFKSQAVVIATGSYTPMLARLVGLRVPIAPVKGYSITTPVNGWPTRPTMPVIDDHLHAAVCPLGDRLRVAGTAEFAGFNHALTPSRVNNLFNLVVKLYPAFAPYLNRAQTIAWTGLRPMSSDGVGIMGKTKVPGVYLNSGHGPLGWTMAAGAGRLVADEVLGLTLDLVLAPYRLARF